MTGKQTPYKYRGRGAFILLNRRNSPQHSPKRRHRDYPRACGGTYLLEQLVYSGEGLSPRVRGNPPVIVQLRVPRRTIPARTGEPIEGSKPARLIEDYPRAYGGTKTGRTHQLPQEGLSPRVRGNRDDEDYQPPRARTIPARTGEP